MRDYALTRLQGEAKEQYDYIIERMRANRKNIDVESFPKNGLYIPEGMTVDQVLYAYIHGGIRYNKDGSVMEEKDE